VSAKEPGELDAFLDRLNREYAHARWVTVQADLHTPPAVEARLVDEHFERRDRMLLVLDGDLRRSPPRIEIRAMDDEISWRVFADLKRSGWQEHAAFGDRAAAPHVVEGLVTASRLRCPPIEYIMACIEGTPVGFCSVWEGLHGIGQVEDLFVDRHHRGRGIGTALLHHSVALARSRGAGPIIIAASDTDSTNQLYSALGWRPLTICRQYSRRRVSPCVRCDAQR
jgi:GNAT superfamily N-acetyltransferase